MLPRIKLHRNIAVYRNVMIVSLVLVCARHPSGDSRSGRPALGLENARYRQMNRANELHRLGMGFRSHDYRKFAVRSEREVLRVVRVAVETAARFTRERIDMSPMSWLMTPKRLFEDRSPIEACRSIEGFRRAMVIHGLSISADLEPACLDGIPIHDFLSKDDGYWSDEVPPSFLNRDDGREPGPLQLYSCTVSTTLGVSHLHAFCAMIARSPAEVRLRLKSKFGHWVEDEAVVRLGFDWSEPLACAMVSEAMAQILALVADDPTSPLAQGLDFQVEQRFAS